MAKDKENLCIFLSKSFSSSSFFPSQENWSAMESHLSRLYSIYHRYFLILLGTLAERIPDSLGCFEIFRLGINFKIPVNPANSFMPSSSSSFFSSVFSSSSSEVFTLPINSHSRHFPAHFGPATKTTNSFPLVHQLFYRILPHCRHRPRKWILVQTTGRFR